LLVRNAGRVLFKVHVPNPSAAQPNQGVPVSGKRQLENHAEHAIIVIFDLSFQAFAAVQHQSFDRLHYGWPLVPNIARSRILEAGLLQSACAKKLTQLVEANLLANIELNKD